MKTIYSLKHALLLMVMFLSAIASAQKAKETVFTEIDRPVVVTNGMDSMSFSFESGAAWGDYNNDGFLDLVTAGVTNGWAKLTMMYKNNGNGTFTKVTHPFPNLECGNVTWLDYNNDGNLDIFLSGKDDIGYYSTLYKNLGPAMNYEFSEVLNGTFDFMANGGGNRANRYAIACDYNNDGWVDLFMQGENESGRHSFLYKNLKGTGFEKVVNPVNGTANFIQLNAGSAAFADYDGDGFQDLLATGYSSTLDYWTEGYKGVLYRNNGNGTFANPVLFKGTESGESAWCDYNNDGKWDYFVSGVGANSNGWYWISDIYENAGSGNFTVIPSEQNGMPNNKQESSIAWGDVNNDGYEDVLYMNAGPNAVFLNNSGDQTFTRSNLSFAGIHNDDGTATTNVWGGTACLADIDNDKDLDAFMIAYGGRSKALLMRNDLGVGIPVNAAPTVPTGLNAVVSGGNATISWTASTDDLCESQAIRYNFYLKKDGDTRTMFMLPANLTTGRLKVNDNLTSILGTSYKLFDLENGTYTLGVQAIDNAKNASTFATSTFTITQSSLKSTLENAVKVLSTSKQIEIKSTDSLLGNIVVYNANGQELFRKQGLINNTLVQLSAGMYIVKVVSENNTVVNKAIVK
ncbi:MAG TPA: FG-GAP-like repeat-containing protein [Bacteroidales bacterium]|nr:FG-GAP-like repeat-containing protein [Bacteroidales bacterium]